MKLVELGVSQRESFERCRRHWFHSQMMGNENRGIEPQSESLALMFGTLGHTGCRVIYEDIRNGVFNPEHTRDRAISAVREQRNQKYPNEVPEGLAMVEAFVEGYVRFYKDDSEFDVLAIEQEFSIIPSDFYPPEIIDRACEYHGVNQLPILRGTIDLVLDTPTGLIVMDHKFHKYLETDMVDMIGWWKQPKVYTRAAGVHWKRPVRGYIHNQIRKPFGLKPKKINGDMESAGQFMERISQEYVNYPDYAQNYGSKKGYFFRSHPIPGEFNDPVWLNEMAFLDAQMVRTAADIPNEPNWGEAPPSVPRVSPTVACKKYGGWCEFMPLCSHGYSPATLELYREKGEHHR